MQYDEHFKKPMKNRYSITEARRILSAIIRDVENGNEIELTRRGEPVAVLIGIRAFEQLKSTEGDFATAYQEFRETSNLDHLDLDPDELYGDVRKEIEGRETHF